MWTYHQKSGQLFHNGALIATGYSGAPGHINKPEDEALVAKGPIPRGRWRMTALKLTGSSVGPYAIVLIPVGHDAHKRTEFRVHGDSIANPGTASHGCMIFARWVREKMWTSGDHDLEVVV